jgi:hypothetical protein
VKVDYLLGMARSGKKFCLILDTEKVLSTDELLELPDSVETLENPQVELGSVGTPVASEAALSAADEAIEKHPDVAQPE